ncbi:MAG: hypothetical protein GX624_00330 [Actinobacteria bacterium]|nr:hypothetical protein [Actinomycetota bacterium]
MRMIERVSAPLLAEHGFKKRAGAVFTIPIADGVLGWLGLNSATKYTPKGHANVNPIVGVRNQRVEELVAELSGERPHPYNPPTASTPIGYLLPERAYRTWDISEESPEAVADMVATIVEYGLPFMEEHVELSALRSLLAGGHAGPNHKVAYRLPVAMLLLGEGQRATETASRMLADISLHEDEWTRHYRSFIAELHASVFSGE